MKIAEIINEAGGPQMTRRGFLGNLVAAAASKGIDPTGLIKTAAKLGPNLMDLTGDMISWIGEDKQKFDMLTTWIDNWRLRKHMTPEYLESLQMQGWVWPEDWKPIRNKFLRAYRKNNPDSTNDDAFHAYKTWSGEFIEELKQHEGTTEYNDMLDVLRRAKGAPLAFDPILDMVKSHGIEDGIEFFKSMNDNNDVKKLFYTAYDLIRDTASKAMQNAAANRAIGTTQLQTQTAARNPIASQVDKAKSMLDKLASAPDKVKFAIEQQMTAIQTKVAALESAPPELAKTINDKCEWIKNNLDSAVDNPKVAEEIAKQLASIDGVLAELPNAEPVAGDAETDKTTELQA